LVQSTVVHSIADEEEGVVAGGRVGIEEEGQVTDEDDRKVVLPVNQQESAGNFVGDSAGSSTTEVHVQLPLPDELPSKEP